MLILLLSFLEIKDMFFDEVSLKELIISSSKSSNLIKLKNQIGETKTFVEIDFYGEGLDEDERFGVWAKNFGIKFNKEDANILKDYDIKEAYPDWDQLNIARKSLIVNRDQIYPYIGTYKGLSNFVDILGYKDVLQVKEYWKNINKKSQDAFEFSDPAGGHIQRPLTELLFDSWLCNFDNFKAGLGT